MALTSAFVLCGLLGSNRAHAQGVPPEPNAGAQYKAQQQQYREKHKQNQGALANTQRVVWDRCGGTVPRLSALACLQHACLNLSC